jgi:hypothetical protein
MMCGKKTTLPKSFINTEQTGGSSNLGLRKNPTEATDLNNGAKFTSNIIF